jgi:hypothetical protein
MRRAAERVRSADRMRGVLFFVGCCLAAVGPAGGGCPIELLRVSDGTAAWDGLRINSLVEDVQRTVGHPIDLTTDPEWHGLWADVLVGGRHVRLTFHELDGALKLSSMWIGRTDLDDSDCWDRETLIAAFRRAAPKAVYLPSRHQPNQPEASNEYPMYALDERHEVVVMFKLADAVVYMGNLNDLD